MKLLVLSAIAPYPPHDGDRLRLFHHIRSLRQAGHTLDLFCLTRSEADLRNVGRLRPWLRRLHVQHLPNHELFLNLVGGLFHEKSWNVASYHSPLFLRALRDHAATPEGRSVQAVVAHRLRMAPYADAFVKRRSALAPESPSVPWVLDLVDCLTDYTRQVVQRKGFPWTRFLSSRWDTNLLSSEEPIWVGRSDVSLTVSEAEKRNLVALGANADRLLTLTNGVDLGDRTQGRRPKEYPPDRKVVAFVGNLGYAPNEDGALWFLEEVWPIVRRKCPEAFFAAVGGDPSKRLLRRHNGQDILVRGYVPEMDPYVTHAALTVAPLRVASGFQNKVALSLALGTPVVATPQALKGLPLGAEKDLSGGETAGSFAEAVGTRLRKPKTHRVKARRWGSFLRKHWVWDASGRDLDRLIRGLVEGSRRRSGR